MWVFKGKYFWRINKEGGSREDPMELGSFWYGLPGSIDRVDAVYERSDNDIVFFVGNKYYVMAGNTYLKQGPRPISVREKIIEFLFNFSITDPSNAQDLGLPADLAKVDGAMRWGYNDKTYFFSGGLMVYISICMCISGTMYWRYDEEVQHVELDYPRDMAMWKGVPYNIDAVFQYHDKKTYFFKGKHFWEFDNQKMEVAAGGPVPVGEYWLHCPKELQERHEAGEGAATTSAAASLGPALLMLGMLSIAHSRRFSLWGVLGHI
jgi:hypothetical protein